MNLKHQRILFLSLIILWGTVIYCFSNQQGDTSSSISSSITYRILGIFYPKFQQLDSVNQMAVFNTFHVITRKLAHFSEYAILWFFSYCFLRTYPLNKWQCYVMAVIFCFGYASLDEWHQSFIPERSPSFKDVLIDTLGALIGGFLHISLEKKKKKSYKSLKFKR